LSMTTKRRDCVYVRNNNACKPREHLHATYLHACKHHRREATEKIVRLSFSRTRNSAKFLAAQLHPSHCVAQGLTNMRASIRTNILNSQGSDPKTWIISLHLADYVIVAHTTTEMPPTSGRGKRRQRKG
jgi:hypothetical protein